MSDKKIAFSGAFTVKEELDLEIAEACESENSGVRASARMQRALLVESVEALREHLRDEGTEQDFFCSVTAYTDLVLSVFNSVFTGPMPDEYTEDVLDLFLDALKQGAGAILAGKENTGPTETKH